MEILLSLAIAILLGYVKYIEYKLQKESELNLSVISSIFTFLHKEYGITVHEIRKNYDRYNEQHIDYLGRQ